MVANKVFIAIPNTTAAPNAIRLCAPAPVANNKGITPSTKAKDVIRIGRKRTCPASKAASLIELPFGTEITGKFHNQNTILCRKRNQQDYTDLRINTDWSSHNQTANHGT